MQEELKHHCPLCDRDVPHVSDHHLIPKSRGGKEKKPICLDCHRTIHAFFTNKELERQYFSAEALLSNEAFKHHMKWLGKRNANARYRTKTVRRKRH